MNIGKACAIFEQIESDKYTEQDKLQAIKEVITMPTHNGITKVEILKAFRWLFNQVTVEENEKETNAERIFSMDIKELAEFLEKVISGKRETIGINCGNEKCESWKCTECIYKWLQSESE